MPTVQDTNKSLIQIPALAKPKVIQFIIQLFALPSFYMTATVTSI